MFSWKKELTVFIFLFIVLAMTMHFKACIDHPLKQIESLPDSPLGPWHPLFLTAAAYFIVLLFRLLFAGIRRVFSK
ncbi:hypothetical protein [Hydrogenimonas sp. SS33]|uniref:hypothetical protein n=1 Tax=Hydrogenimonas leucolamina TaxID=2954236 RepID=UPI00336BCF94